jgi:hypothetical protein
MLTLRNAGKFKGRCPANRPSAPFHAFSGIHGFMFPRFCTFPQLFVLLRSSAFLRLLVLLGFRAFPQLFVLLRSSAFLHLLVLPGFRAFPRLFVLLRIHVFPWFCFGFRAAEATDRLQPEVIVDHDGSFSPGGLLLRLEVDAVSFHDSKA